MRLARGVINFLVGLLVGVLVFAVALGGGGYYLLTKKGMVGTLADKAKGTVNITLDEEIRDGSLLDYGQNLLSALSRLNSGTIGDLEGALGVSVISKTLSNAIGIDSSIIAGSTIGNLGKTISDNLTVRILVDKFGIAMPNLPIFSTDRFLDSPISTAFQDLGHEPISSFVEINENSSKMLQKIKDIPLDEMGERLTPTINAMTLDDLGVVNEDSPKVLKSLQFCSLATQYDENDEVVTLGISDRLKTMRLAEITDGSTAYVWNTFLQYQALDSLGDSISNLTIGKAVEIIAEGLDETREIWAPMLGVDGEEIPYIEGETELDSDTMAYGGIVYQQITVTETYLYPLMLADEEDPPNYYQAKTADGDNIYYQLYPMYEINIDPETGLPIEDIFGNTYIQMTDGEGQPLWNADRSPIYQPVIEEVSGLPLYTWNRDDEGDVVEVTPSHPLLKALKNSLLTQLNTNISSLKVKDILKPSQYSVGVVGLIPPETVLSDISATLTAAVKTASIYRLDKAGIFNVKGSLPTSDPPQYAEFDKKSVVFNESLNGIINSYIAMFGGIPPVLTSPTYMLAELGTCLLRPGTDPHTLEIVYSESSHIINVNATTIGVPAGATLQIEADSEFSLLFNVALQQGGALVADRFAIDYAAGGYMFIYDANPSPFADPITIYTGDEIGVDGNLPEGAGYQITSRYFSTRTLQEIKDYVNALIGEGLAYETAEAFLDDMNYITGGDFTTLNAYCAFYFNSYNSVFAGTEINLPDTDATYFDPADPSHFVSHRSTVTAQDVEDAITPYIGEGFVYESEEAFLAAMEVELEGAEEFADLTDYASWYAAVYNSIYSGKPFITGEDLAFFAPRNPGALPN